MKTKQKTIRVGITGIPPMVIKQKQKVTGFEVELWECIAEILGWKFDYKVTPIHKAVEALQTGKLDVAFGAITRTKEREKRIDFSHFTLQTGLAIMIRRNSPQRVFASVAQIARHNSRGIMRGIIFFSTLLLGIAHALWLIERGNGVGAMYQQGIIESLWWTVVTLGTIGYGDIVPVTTPGRIFGTAVIVIAVILYGLLLAKITAFFTLERLQYHIQNARDLMNRRVATKANTAVVATCENIGANVTGMKDLKDAIIALKRGHVDAVVFDAPTLYYHEHTEADHELLILGNHFAMQTYGFALKHNSALRNSINIAILETIENGTYESLYKKWFGEEAVIE
jgi:polar amino acid transport system substrate-binding protein